MSGLRMLQIARSQTTKISKEKFINTIDKWTPLGVKVHVQNGGRGNKVE